ncbi:hypothetical protein Trydic_g3094 [Trypoxylus dichotomus]
MGYTCSIYALKNQLLLKNCKHFYSVNSDFTVLPALLSKNRLNSANVSSVNYGDYSFNLIRNMSDQPSTSGAAAQQPNRLSLEKSPYLLQHAYNPVQWYPWGNEAFEKAKKENKIIFLSVGYSTCHWCHVMEKESFENQSVAEIMNKNFICIKVDREERPDVDKMYMSFVQRTTGGGGWPMSVFLTPDLEPLFGGTYFPPEDKYGRVGFKSILTLIAKQWTEQHSVLSSEAKSSVSALKRMSTFKLSALPEAQIPGFEAAKKCLLQFSKSYEKEYGGFSTAPKFPQPSIFEFMFHIYSKDTTSEQGKECLNMSLHTLRRMAYGGIHDHVNTGFARYSVDGKWHVPHFEKMLYDQGQLAMAYTDAYVITRDNFFSDIVMNILNYVSRDLSHKLGGFYGAEDADSYPYEGALHKQEGAFCVWEYNEINNLLDDKTDEISHAEVFCYHYSVKKNGNVNPGNDPHGELKNKNVLAAFGTYEDTASKFKIPISKLKEILNKCHKVLYEERQKRPKPHVDTKIVTSWNGLMLSGFAKAAFALDNKQYADRAVLAANFIKKYLYDPKSKTVLRCCYRGEDGGICQTGTPISGFVDDYAFLIRGILDLYEATLDSAWLEWCEILQDQQDKLFWDSTNFGFFTSPEGDASILIREKEDQDGAEPCGNSVAVSNLIRLSAYLNRPDYREKARGTLAAFSERLREIPFALPLMTSALMHYGESLPQVFIVGPSEDPNTKALLDVVRSNYLPGRLLAILDGPSGGAKVLYSKHEAIGRMTMIQGKPTAYVCRNFTCSLPVTDAEALANALQVEAGMK